MSDAFVHNAALMGTTVSIRVVGHGATPSDRRARRGAVARAVAWFAQVEAVCSRFDPDSELSRLTRQVGVPVRVSELLHEVLCFALGVAEQSGGAFDPTVGDRLIARGFDRNFRSGQTVSPSACGEATPSYHDVSVDADTRTITLGRPLRLDLGAVAKGLAIDLAAQALREVEHFTIDAGGDVYVGGNNADGAPWSVGIRHPLDPHRLIDTVRLSDMAVCTSGTYERGHHLLDPRNEHQSGTLASVTVVASSAMVADALATAAYVLGADDGPPLLESVGVEGLFIRDDLTCSRTDGFPHA